MCRESTGVCSGVTECEYVCSCGYVGVNVCRCVGVCGCVGMGYGVCECLGVSVWGMNVCGSGYVREWVCADVSVWGINCVVCVQV